MRAIVVFVPMRSLLEYLTGKRALANVPEGARLTSAWVHTSYHAGREGPRALAVRVEHESFADVTGLRIPFVKAQFRRIAK
jgi:hypothetical protein